MVMQSDNLFYALVFELFCVLCRFVATKAMSPVFGWELSRSLGALGISDLTHGYFAELSITADVSD